MKLGLATLILVGACTPQDRSRPAPPPMKPVAQLADATQSGLAKELDDAGRLGTWSDVKARWQGQRLHWTVSRYKALCGSAAACNVAVFPIQRPARHGWLPTLELAPGQYDALAARCANVDPCEVTIDATLDKLDVSDAMPTNVKLAGVTIADAATRISQK